MTVSQTPTADQLRNRLVDAILAERRVPADVERAMRTVPRHAFLPGLKLENAYTDQAVTIKDNPGKPLPLSCASVPSVVAMMLEQLDARAADDVLEIGAGTGYNAALLAEFVASGSVTTVGNDPDVALHARTRSSSMRSSAENSSGAWGSSFAQGVEGEGVGGGLLGGGHARQGTGPFGRRQVCTRVRSVRCGAESDPRGVRPSCRGHVPQTTAGPEL
ncbi:hypothetical protein ACFYUG_29665 [Streptomyces albogriseolus]|uniref:hypothetical protein n=1 Tax=Streptomyces albogriseolus TaxID=1887 RepID=UPI0036A2249C